MGLALLLAAMLTQWSQVLLDQVHPPEHTLAVPAVTVLVMLLGITGLGSLLLRQQILTRAELLCVFFAMLFGVPLMTQGFWHRIVAIAGTIPRTGDFAKMDSFHDNLWPHGPNLLAAGFGGADVTIRGPHGFEEIEHQPGRRTSVLVLRGEGAARFRLPAELLPGEPHLVSVLLRPVELGAESAYYGRIYYDDDPQYDEVFRESRPAQVTFAQPKGFLRVGAYGVKFSPRWRQAVYLEFGLSGPGRLELCDPKLFSVDALESAHTGRQVVRRSEYEALPAAERAGLIVKPDQMWSWAGLKFVLGGYIPWNQWVTPLATWAAFFGLILLATLAVCVIMRRQWAENERFPFPVARIPAAWLGEGESEERPWAAIWGNWMMWVGFAITLAWCLMRGWHFYNPKVPNLNVNVPLEGYFSGAEWGTMWRTTFKIHAIFLALALLMELNVLLSLVAGYWLYRSLMWVGYLAGWDSSVEYPFGAQQSMASYITYGILILWFSRKYLARVVRAAIRGDRAESAGEMFSYRAAFGLLGLTFVGALAWGAWLGISLVAVALYFGFMVLTGFVAAKFRAECGAPFGYYSPYNTWLFITLMGGLAVFGSQGVVVFLVASFMLTETVFFLIPGAQLEFAELGRRFRIEPRHLFYTAVLGVAGGFVWGGWVFLSNAYSLGGDTVRYQWSFADKAWYFFSYNAALNAATGEMLGQASGAQAATGWLTPERWAYLYAAAGTAAVTVLRQMFAGFWFHPFGFIMGSSRLMDHYIWGSCLVAWVVRSLVLKFGGAATVKNRLVPFAIGMFLAGCLSYLIWGVYASYLTTQNVEVFYGDIP